MGGEDGSPAQVLAKGRKWRRPGSGRKGLCWAWLVERSAGLCAELRLIRLWPRAEAELSSEGAGRGQVHLSLPALAAWSHAAEQHVFLLPPHLCHQAESRV